MEPKDMHELLAGRTITSVEEGTTPGWMVLNVDVPQEISDMERMFLTIYVGGRNGGDLHSWSCALHLTRPKKSGQIEVVRDGREPHIPMAQ